MIAAHPRIKEQSKFLFIPGPEDLGIRSPAYTPSLHMVMIVRVSDFFNAYFSEGPANILPRPALPKMFSKEVHKHLPDAVFSSNPCR